MPKQRVKLVFYSDDMDPVQIEGRVEDTQVNMFSKDPELIVSIICPDPYFTSLDPIVLTGQTVAPRGGTVSIDYKGTVEAGIGVKVTSNSASATPFDIAVQIGPWTASQEILTATAIVNTGTYFDMSSVPTRKYSQNVAISNGVITNLLNKTRLQPGTLWPTFQPGENEFSVVTNSHAEDWELTYYEKFGGL
jgi:hypothetical protein